MIWLIDGTHYNRHICSELALIRSDYLRIKKYKRFNVLGDCATAGTRLFALGILRIATILDRNGIDVKYMDLEQLNLILAEGVTLPETVAFSCVCPTVDLCAELAKRIKELSPSTKLVLGGVHVNLCLEQTAHKYPIFDTFSYGYELAAAEKVAGRELESVTEPYADYSLLPFPLKEYYINTFTTSGCPFKCSYCADGRAPRFSAALDGQIRIMKEFLPARTMVHFFDSVLGYSTIGTEKVCQAIMESEHDFMISCDMRADMITPHLLSVLQKAGFVELRMGLESADQDLLDRNNRSLIVNDFIEKMKLIRDHSNMYITLYTIAGLPGSSEKTHKESIWFYDYLLYNGYADEIKNTQYVPYPMKGVDYKARGVYITTEDWSKYDRQSFPVYFTDELSSLQLWNQYLEMASCINDSWLRSCGFSSYDEIPAVGERYSEYMENTYNLIKGGEKENEHK